MQRIRSLPWAIVASLAILVAAAFAPAARADVVSDWNTRAIDVVSAAPGNAIVKVRAVAIAQCAVFEAVNAITGRYPPMHGALKAEPDTSIDAAVASATVAALSKALPATQAPLAPLYQTALTAIAEGPAKSRGIALGEQSAAAMLALRADDGAAAPDDYRPKAAPGVYVPTAPTVGPQWGRRKPWAMSRGDQFRPGPPPALTSALWARDYNEVKALGAKTGSTRTPEQTDIARFWETTGVAVYFPLARSVVTAPGREVTRNARLLAVLGMAMDDAYIAVFDAKYAYEFWRPVTAIRNGAQDGNDATAPDAAWTPFIDTPMHPEYPCAHCIQAAAVGTVLAADLGRDAVPPLSSVSTTATGMVRRWTSIDDFVAEVQLARIYDGVHYRNSAEVGSAMGRKVGAAAVEKFMR